MEKPQTFDQFLTSGNVSRPLDDFVINLILAGALAFLLSRLRHPKFPEPIGVFRDIEVSSYDTRLNEQIDRLSEKMGEPDLQALLTGPDPWTVT